MKFNENHVSYVIGLLISILVAISIVELSRLPLRYLFSAVFGLLTFLIYCLLFKGTKISLKLRKNANSKFGFFGFNQAIILVYLISIFLVLIIPQTTNSQFVGWNNISPMNYVRLFAGLLLSTLLPGYALLRLIDRKKRFVGLDAFIFSFFISVFLLSVLSYSIIVLGFLESINYLFTLCLNLILLAAFSFSLLKNNAQLQNGKTQHHHNLDYLIIACIFIFFIAGWSVYYSNYQLGSPGDMWDHYSVFLRLSNGGSLLTSQHLAYLTSETWFSLHYISVFQLTGFPSLNGWMIYSFINFFYVLAFYQLVRCSSWG